MTMPSREVQRSRQTASEAERHFFVQRLEALVRVWRNTGMWEFERCAEMVEALIAERTK